MTRQERTRRFEDRLRTIAFVVGLCIAVIFISSMRFPANGGSLGADVHLIAAPTGELAVKPVGVVLEGVGLEPGSDPVTGDLKILNQTGVALDLRVRGIPANDDLDRSLWISVAGPDGEQLYRGDVGGFRAWTTHAVTFEPGQWRPLHFECWLPDDTPAGYEGRLTQIDLAFDVRPEAAP